MKKSDSPSRQQNAHLHDIPDIDIIDLENDGDNLSDTNFDNENEKSTDDSYEDSDENWEEDAPRKKGIRSFLNVHVLFFLVFIGIVLLIVFRFKNWGVNVDLAEIFKDGQGTYDNTFDNILPVIDENGKIVESNTETPVIVAFGNAPFADDRDSESNLCNMIAEETGATIYNCSVSGSYLSTQNPYFDVDAFPMDAYSFYWLITLATGGPIDHYYTRAAEVLGDATPPEAQEVYDTLTTLDFNTVDVIAIMYDGSDYLIGRGMYSDQNSTDIQQFTGNLEAGIELIQSIYPHIRIIVMSPTYVYAIDQDGNYVSSDMYTYGQDVFSSYVIRQATSCNIRSVTFVDNLYGTITEDNAEDYLIDNIHLNEEGRKLVAARFEYALNYYTKGYAHLED